MLASSFCRRPAGLSDTSSFLTIRFIFFKVELDQAKGFVYHESDEFDTDLGFVHLHSLLSQSPDDLGAARVPIIENVTVGTVLGKGATSIVYQGSYQATEVAVKFVAVGFVEQATNEVNILRALHSHNQGKLVNGIPFLPINGPLPENCGALPAPRPGKVPQLDQRK